MQWVVRLSVMADNAEHVGDESHAAVLAEFLADRGRYPELGDVLERDRRADIEASYVEDGTEKARQSGTGQFARSARRVTGLQVGALLDR